MNDRGASDGGAGTGMLRIDIEGAGAFAMAAGEDSLLRGALRAGLAFPYECSVGGCGACRFELVEGEMATLWADAPGLSERDRRRGKRLACQSRPLGDCRIRARLDTDAGDAIRPRRGPARLLGRRAVGGDMVELSFRVSPDARFRPGQYALLVLPGVAGARAYSMSHADDGSGVWRFIVRRVPGGAGSGLLCDRLAPGELIEIDGPYGHAWLRDEAAAPAVPRDVVCVAGGSGLGPMLSVAQGVLSGGGTRRVHFFLGLRAQHELGAARELQALPAPRVQCRVVLSQPDAAQPWDGATGFVHQAVAAALPAPLAGFDFHFAGPPPMIDAMQQLLAVQHRVPHAQIHFDRFV